MSSASGNQPGEHFKTSIHLALASQGSARRGLSSASPIIVCQAVIGPRLVGPPQSLAAACWPADYDSACACVVLSRGAAASSRGRTIALRAIIFVTFVQHASDIGLACLGNGIFGSLEGIMCYSFDDFLFNLPRLSLTHLPRLWQDVEAKTGGVYLSPASKGSGDYIPAFKGGRLPASEAFNNEASELHDAELDTRLGAGSKVFGNPMFDDETEQANNTPKMVKMNSFFSDQATPPTEPRAPHMRSSPDSMSRAGSASYQPTASRTTSAAFGGNTMVQAFDDEEEEEVVATPVVSRPRAPLATTIRQRDKFALVWESEMKQMIGGRDREAAVYRPAPSDCMIRCYVKRVKNFFGTHCSFQMHLENGDVFLLAARRRKKSKVSSYVISADLEDLKRDTDNCLSKLKANFTGTEYILWGKSEDPHVKKGYAHEQLCITFRKGAGASTGGPRTMYSVLPLPEAKFRPGQAGDGHDTLANALELSRDHTLPASLEKKLIMLATKPAEYDEQNKAFTLDFKGRVKEASVKNFQLVHWDHHTDRRGSEVALQFGKIEDDLYALDFTYPFNTEIAFSIALASIDTKLCYSI
eukprot:gene1157-3961_t